MTYYELFSKLKHVTRYSGVNLIQPERLESHILEMVGLAFDLHSKFNDFDLDKCIRLIVIHDIDEAVTVDVPRPFKYFDPSFKVILNETVNSYLEYLGFDKEFLREVRLAKNMGLEGQILTLLDLIQVKRKLHSEVSLGNSNLGNMIDEVDIYISDLNKDMPELSKYINELI